MRCSETGVAGRLGGGFAAAGARAPIGLGLAVVLRAFALLAGDRSGAPFAPFAAFLRVVTVLRVVPALLRAALPTGGFLRVVLALPLTFFFVFLFAIGVSLALTAFCKSSSALLEQ
jgi:hypothetical protein